MNNIVTGNKLFLTKLLLLYSKDSVNGMLFLAGSSIMEGC